MRPDINIDMILHHLGKLGKWQVSQYALQVMCLFHCLYVSLTIVFVGYEPPFRCRLPSRNGSGNNTTYNNSFVAEGRCTLRNNGTNETSSCVFGYDYVVERETSFVSQWDLVCDRRYFTDLTQLAFTIGQTIGSFGWSVLADVYGRKPIYIVSFLTSFSSEIAIIFAPDIKYYTFFRFLCGLTIVGIENICFILGLEYFPADLVTQVGFSFSTTWALSLTLMPALAFPLSFYSWRYYHTAVLFTGVTIFYQIFVMDESFRWLLATGRKKKAVTLIKKASRTNKIAFDDISAYLNDKVDVLYPRQRKNVHKIKFPKTKCSDGILITFNANKGAHTNKVTETMLTEPENESCLEMKKMISESALATEVVIEESGTNFQNEIKYKNSKKQETQLSLILRNNKLRKVFLSMQFLWVTNALTYFSLIYMSNSFAGNRFLNFSIGGAVEIPAVLFTYYSVKWIGFRKSCIVWHFVCGIVLLVVVITSAIYHDSIPPTVETALSITARMIITMTYIAIYRMTPRLFPTPVRTLGLGCSNLSSKLGYIAASFSSYFGKIALWAPIIVFTAMCFISSLLSFVPPETHNKPLPQTIDEFELLYDSKTKENELK